MKKYFFKGVVSHRRVKSKKHGFDYPYRSIFLENIYDFKEDEVDHIESTFFNFSFEFFNYFMTVSFTSSNSTFFAWR